MYIIRKIDNEKKFTRALNENPNNIKSGDFLVHFTTQKCEISLWLAETEEDIDKILTAICIGQDQLQTAYYIRIPFTNTQLEKWKRKKKVTFKFSHGETSWPEINSKHYAVKGLNAKNLGLFCEEFMELYKQNKEELRKIEQAKIIKLTKDNESKINTYKFKEKLKQAIFPKH